METHMPTIELGPISLNLTLLAMCLVTVGLSFAFVYWASRRMQIRPQGKQTALESLYQFVAGIGQEHLEAENQKHYNLLLFTTFLFLAVANNLGLLTRIESTSGETLWTSPTAHMAFDLALSFLVTVICHVEGIRRRGVKNYLKAFVTPVGMTPMNLLEEVTNFLSLALRIFGNIFAGEVVTGLIVKMANHAVYWYPVAFLLNILWTAFSIFISLIQAYVFTKLFATYLGAKVNDVKE